jgi:hypothetical protein
MPISVTSTAGGTGYVDIRVGTCQIHQMLVDVSTLGSADDADGYLPVGLPLNATGAPVGTGEDAYGIVGPEPVLLGTVDHFGNCILAGVLNRDAIEDNLGRALSADELAGIASGMPQIRLV